jgi:predicted component of type VI protein secretion system
MTDQPVLLLRVTAVLPHEEFRLTGTTADIGRLPTSTIMLAHRSVSREHARITAHGDGYLVEDVGSKNGTWLGDERVTTMPVPLTSGATLLVGDVPLLIELTAPARQPPPQPAAPPPPSGGPATVWVGLDDVLAETSPPSSSDDHPTILEEPPSLPSPGTWQPAPVLTPRPQERAHAEPVTQPEPLVEATEPGATFASLAQAAEQLATALRTLSGDVATAVWIFEHAGGRDAAFEFIERVNIAHLHPEDEAAQQAVLDYAPTAARLLQAATLIVRGLLPLDVDAADGRTDEPQSDATQLQPIASE